MSYSRNISLLVKELGSSSCKLDEPLYKYTTVKIGGPAEVFYEAKSIDDLVRAVKLARKLKVPVTVLGGGSNVLISDSGIKGLVIRNLSNKIRIMGKIIDEAVLHIRSNVKSRWQADRSSGTFRGIEFHDLDYDEKDKPRVEVVMDSGVNLQFALNYLLDRGVTGLQWFAGIPGTIGGAVYNNIHGGTHFLSETIKNVKVLGRDTKIRDLGIECLGFDYDKSRFHKSGEVILQVTFSFYKGDVNKAKNVAREWAKRKSIQPMNSPGCAFMNISEEEMRRLGYPTTSAGYVIEHGLKMTGFRIGDAAISRVHHNFIVNKGQATANEYLAVMKEIYKRAKRELGLKLKPEIVLLGFCKKDMRF